MNEKLNRQQRRQLERSNQEAQEIHRKLSKIFMDFFMDNDPESEAVAQKEKEVVAKWRLYCDAANLLEKARPMMTDFCKSVRERYNLHKG